MTPDRPLLTQPRTAGEILDDAWRLAFADFPLLFALAGLFLIPFFAVMLLLIALPRPEGWPLRILCAASTALLGVVTGIGSGACQEVFRRRADGAPAGFGGCLASALRRVLDHVAARAMILPAVFLGFLCMMAPAEFSMIFSMILGFGCVLLPSALIWLVSFAIHTIIANGKGRRSADLKELGREARFDLGKTSAVVLSRLPLLTFAMLSLHFLGGMVLFVAGNLGGFDVALVGVALTLSNPVYLIALTMLAWLFLTPYFEASNFLLHLDTRTRQEGLDLFYRVRRSFPTDETRRTGVLFSLVVAVLFASPVAAADVRISAARGEVGRIAEEIKSADPYPGSERWSAPLQNIADRLEAGDAEKYAWFRRRLTGFAQRDRTEALNVLSDLDRHLARLDNGGERSKEELKNLLRPPRDHEEDPESDKRLKELKRREREEPPEVKRDVDAPQGKRSTSGSAPAGSGGGGGSGMMLVVGLLLALVMTARVLWFRNRVPAPEKPQAPTEGKSAPRNDLPRPDEASAQSLWRKAEELAAKGEYLEALRSLYGAVLTLLHRRHLIRYEVMRTNGEYVQQVRLAAEAPPGLSGPFERMTTLFEWKWYGERACDGNDFAAGKGLAEEVRGLAG